MTLDSCKACRKFDKSPPVSSEAIVTSFMWRCRDVDSGSPYPKGTTVFRGNMAKNTFTLTSAPFLLTVEI